MISWGHARVGMRVRGRLSSRRTFSLHLHFLWRAGVSVRDPRAGYCFAPVSHLFVFRSPQGTLYTLARYLGGISSILLSSLDRQHISCSRLYLPQTKQDPFFDSSIHFGDSPFSYQTRQQALTIKRSLGTDEKSPLM